jgi:hypothetical protein
VFPTGKPLALVNTQRSLKRGAFGAGLFEAPANRMSLFEVGSYTVVAPARKSLYEYPLPLPGFGSGASGLHLGGAALITAIRARKADMNNATLKIVLVLLHFVLKFVLI